MTDSHHPEAEAPPGYPEEWAADVVLSDGSTAHVRPIRPADGDLLAALHSRLSSESIYFRFFSPMPRLSARQVERFTHVDYQHRFALVAVIEDELVAVARYDQQGPPDAAEVAFVVDDAYQGRGLGTLLLEHLAAVARTRGMRQLIADVLPENQRMLGVFREAGFERHTSFADGFTRVRLDIEPTPASEQAMAEREARADRRSIERILRPTSVAVIGASATPGTIGHELFRNLLAGEFAGPVYPVNEGTDHVASVRAYPNVGAIPDEVDLAIVVVPAAAVPDVVDQCGAKGVRGLVVISAGYAEAGPDGAEAERALVRQARARGMRLIGPNCMGIINASPEVRLNATFAPVAPRAGGVAFSSQSGALGIAILQEAERLGLGLSTFVSVGNKADVSGNDLIQYWEEDPETDVILLYLESFGNPRKFSRIARRVSRRKPIVAVKSGRSQAGLRAAAAHTAAGSATEATVDALFRHAGVIRVDTLQQLFDVAKVLANQPLPAGPRVGIVSNGGGPGILAADTCEAVGLEVAELADDTHTRLAAVPHLTTAHNPVHLGPRAAADSYEAAVRAVADDPGVDAVLAVFVPPLETEVDEVAAAIARATDGAGKPILANVLAHGHVPVPLRSAGIPVFDYPEAAVHALARVCAHADWREQPAGEPPDFGSSIDLSAIRALVHRILDSEPDGRALSAEEAREVLSELGVGLGTADADEGESGGLACRLVAVDDPHIGPTLSFVAGGAIAEAVGDGASRLVPLTDADASRLLREPKGAALLAERPEVMAALEDLALRISVAVEEIPELSRVVIEVLAGEAGLRLRSVEAAVHPSAPQPEHLVRRLR